MIVPKYLKKGDTIAIVATARKVTRYELEPAVSKFKSWGLKVLEGDNLYNDFFQFAGNDNDRIFDLQQMLNNTEVNAIICARGGYGTVRIIDKINFEKFLRNPKWIIGFSDATVLHSHVNTNFGIETIHAEMPLNFPKDGSDNISTESLRKCLFGEKVEYSFQSTKNFRYGNVKGILIGGNLSIIYSLAGSVSDISTNGRILFLEDLDEYLYHIDRMMTNLKRSGKLQNLAGLIVGGMTEMKDNSIPFGMSVEEIILEAVKEFDYPVCFGFPSGHLPNNAALIFGRQVQLMVDNRIMKLEFKHKT